MQKWRAAALLIGFVIGTLLVMPVQYLLIKRAPHSAFAAKAQRRLPRLYHTWLCRWLGLRIRVVGAPARDHAVLFLSNHTSYFDILAISTAGEVSFIAKSEVANWPFFGWGAQVMRTVFVDRQRRSKTAASRDEMAARLKAGDNLVLFPEGTSNDGNGVLPFKSALIGSAQQAVAGEGLSDILIQPMSIIYRKVHGVPMGRQYRPYFAWYGDMELLDHLFAALSLGPIEIDIVFHDALPADIARDRKKAAAMTQQRIGQGVAEALSVADRPRALV